MLKLRACYKDAAPDGALSWVGTGALRCSRAIPARNTSLLLKCGSHSLGWLSDDGECFGAEQILIPKCDQHAGMVSRIAQLGQGTSRPTPDLSTTKFCPQALHENLTSDGTGMFGLISVCFRL